MRYHLIREHIPEWWSAGARNLLHGMQSSRALHLEDIESHWGEGALAEVFFGDAIADIPGFRDYYGRYQRMSASPTMASWL